jgi:1-pyrroline-5-carboxylate dehydrogenase
MLKLDPFKNEPMTDFTLPDNAALFYDALDLVKSKMGRTYPLVIGGERIELDETFATVNPARPDEVLGYFPDAPAEYADQAIAAAEEAFETWKQTAPEARARYLLRAAAEMRRRKHEFSALMVLEVGKSWIEADADTAEAIDFLEYYARQIIEIANRTDKLHPSPLGEEVDYQWIPLGVGAIIPPWNFPNAILAGMTSAAIVAGNSVVLKPAEQSPLIGWHVADLFWQLNLPAGVLNFITSADGAVTGGRMVEHPKTRFVAFTGSREVGTQIYAEAAKVQPGQTWLKRMILEMGGKDAVLVDETADLDAAAEGIVSSAFGFQGQKCSAGSRAILVDEIYDTVAEKVVNLARDLQVGETDEGHNVYMGPVIDPDAFEKIRHYIEVGTDEGELLLGGNPIENEAGGYFLQPTIFGDVPDDARIATEEIFGPVLALMRASDFEDALRIANNTEYGLTGAVYSERRERLEQARREFHVGNLYLNRKCTGALVGVHPFGGFNMSGTDSKAGGPEYLLLFTQAKSIAERL